MRAQPHQKVIVAAVYVCGMLMNTLDSTVVNVALATLAGEFSVSPASIEAVVIGYLVSLAVFIPTSGWLGDRWGTKRIFLIALGIFTAASALCGIAQSLDQLVLFRILQGAGGGLLTPVGMAMLYRTFPPSERIGVGRVLMFATILGPALGPIIGGLLIQQLSWRWIFYVNIPVGLAALMIGGLFLHEHREADPGRFDLPAFLLAGAGFALTMFALTEGPARGWGSPLILVTGTIGVVTLVTFVIFELRTTAPMIQLHLLGNRLFRTTLIVSFCGSAGFMGVLFVMPLFLQEARGLTPLESGLAITPEALGVVLSTQIVARIYPRVGPRRLMAAGLLGVGVMSILLAFVDLDTNIWLIRLLMFLIGVGIAYLFLPNQAASLATISSQATGRATTISMMQRQLGGAVGIATLSTVLSIAGVTHIGASGQVVPNVDAYQSALLVAAGFALLGALLALRVPDSDAAETMRARARRPARREPATATAD